ncbi:MAG TPA: hypothetical protein VGC61_01620 [Pyrinomonadaceae bacterium]|jgi:hypothetical protein
MRSGPHGIFSSPTSRATTLAAIIVLCLSVETPATPARSNVVCRQELSPARREQLADKLRIITGLQELEFGDDGVLREGNAHPAGGSASARGLVHNAIHGRKVVVIEDASNRADVAFAQVVPGRWKTPASSRPPVFVVQIDFLDFEQLVGDERALEAFNVGWGFLHELDHVVNESPDTKSLGEAGECEAHINQMRRECDLPERTDYFSAQLPLAPDNAFRTQLVRLAFEQKEPSANKKKRYWVIWDATIVGGVKRNQVAALR